MARERPVRQWLLAIVAARLSLDATRHATLFERLTVQRCSWDLLIRLNTWLSLGGKIATGIWVAFCCSVVLGIDWKRSVEHVINSGKPVAGAVVLVFALPTALFLLARSVIGYMRWRVQRELWRREVASLTRRTSSSSRTTRSGQSS